VSLIELSDVRKTYDTGHVQVDALRGVDAHIEEGEYVAVTGPSGSGKSTLMHVLAGLDSATSGRTWLGDTETTSLDEVRAEIVGVSFSVEPGAAAYVPVGHDYPDAPAQLPRDGIEIPRWVALKMEGFLDDAASVRAFGLDVVTELCEKLIQGGAPGLHFYTMNQSPLTLEICKRLGA